jgi:hypothetical protein
MKQEIKFTYTLEHTNDDINVGVPRKIEIIFDGQADLQELTEQFNAFVKAIGYNPPDNCVLDWVDVETGQPPEDDISVQDLLIESDAKNEIQKEFAKSAKKNKSNK